MGWDQKVGKMMGERNKSNSKANSVELNCSSTRFFSMILCVCIVPVQIAYLCRKKVVIDSCIQWIFIKNKKYLLKIIGVWADDPN